MGNSLRQHPGLLTTIALSAALIMLTALTNPVGSQTTQGDPKDGFYGVPEDNAADFEVYLQKLGFGEVAGSEIAEEPFTCSKPSKCGDQSSVRLRIVPSNYASDVHWDDALTGGRGHVVAKIVNLDAVPFDRFNLIKDDVAYLWVGSLKNGRKGAVLYHMRKGQLSNIFEFTTIKYCKHSDYQKPSVHRRAPTCTDPDPKPAPLSVPKASNEPFVALASRSRVAPDRALAGDGLWISCSIGCCEVQYGFQ